MVKSLRHSFCASFFAIVALLALVWVPAVQAQTAQPVPTCWPSPFGTGTPAAFGSSSDGVWVRWHCPTAYSYTDAFFVSSWSTYDFGATQAAATQMFAATDPQAAAASLWAQHAKLDPFGEQLGAVTRAAIQDLRANRPADPVYKVAVNGRYPDRPTYPYANGVRVATAAGRAAVGALCACKAAAIVEGAVTYCSVAPDRVAVCKRE